MSGILATFARLKNSGGGGGGPPLVANRFTKNYTLFTDNSGFIGWNAVGPIGSLDPGPDYAAFNDIDMLRQAFSGVDFIELRLVNWNSDPYMFEFIILNGMTLTNANLSNVAFPPGFFGIQSYPESRWYWANGENGFTLNAPMVANSNYQVSINAWILDTTVNFTIGLLGTIPNRTFGYIQDFQYGTLNSATGDIPFTIRYYEPLNRTEIFGVDELGSQIFKYFGQTLTARYNGADTLFTSALYSGVGTYPTDKATLYTAAGDPFNMIGQVGQTRIVQIVSNG